MKIDQAVMTLRSYVESKEKSPTALVREAADDYQRACNELNGLLARLEDLLNRCLRTEAIQFANIEPRLEDLASLLDFPGKDNYELLAPFHDLPVPPSLHMETIKNLQTAYVEYQQCENLFKTLRRLVLEKASISERLNVMREISNFDRINATLIEDIGILEKNVQNRFIQGIRKAVKDGDDGALETLIDEYYFNNWINPPSPEVIAIIEKHRGQYLEKRLKTLANRATQSMHSGDLQSAKKHYGDWATQAKTLGVQKGDRYWTAIEQVVRWMEHFDQMESLREYVQMQLLTLQSAVKAPAAQDTAAATIQKLEEHYLNAEEAVNQYNETIPPDLRKGFPKMAIPKDLEMEYHRCVEKLTEHSKKNEIFILVGLFAGGAFLLIAFLVWVVSKSR